MDTYKQFLKNPSRRFIWMVLVICATFSFHLQAVGATTDAITVTNTVHVGEIVGQDTIWLAGLTDDSTAAEPSDALAVIWRLDASGWFPTWQLELVGDSGLMPTGLQTTTKDGKASALLNRVQPVVDHTYEVTLSYSSSLGALAVRVVDLKEDRVVYSNGFSLAPSDRALYASAGEVTYGYLPVATSWQVGMESGRTFLALQHFANRNEEAAVRLQVPAPAPGEYRIYHVFDQDETLLAAVRPDIGEHRIPIDLEAFPLGSSTLRLEYVHDGQTLLSEARQLVVGRVQFSLQPLRPERDLGVVRSAFTIQSEEPYDEEIIVDIHATLFELQWDPETRTFRDVPYMQGIAVEGAVIDLSSGTAVLPVEIPFPDSQANWKLVLSAEVTPQVATTLAGQERLFSSHLPAELEVGEPYTIVVFPDTQNLSQHYPTVYTRMTDWVTANAADHTIAALLHVGDITNHDTPEQWTNAYRSMSLLHGVVPYVLTLGNHDMTAGAGGQVSQRGLSRINNYFSVEEARRYSNLIETMTPNRLENHYHLFNLAGDDYLVIALEFGPPNEAVDWANTIAAQYPDHRMILLTHSYTTNSGGLSRSPFNYELGSNPDTTVNSAHELWAKLVRPNRNSFMVVSGHTWPSAPVVPYRVPQAADGHRVFELLFDWQAEPNGGNGWLGLLTFHPDNTLEVRVYSPYLGEYGQYRDGNLFTSHVIFDLETGLSRRIYN